MGEYGFSGTAQSASAASDPGKSLGLQDFLKIMHVKL